MAIENPPTYLQARNDHPASSFRKALAATAGTEESLVATQDALVVSERAAGANMSVDVAPGSGLVLDNAGGSAGVYGVSNDAVLNVPISAADVQDRIDLVGVRVYDSQDNAPDLTDEAVVEVITGTASGSPVPPSVPATDQFMALAEVLVPGSTTSIIDSNITDVRNVHPVASPSYEMVTYTSSGTFSKSDYPWASRVRVRVVGGGGGTGQAAATGAGEIALGGSGGGGAYAESVIDINTVPTNAVVTVGAGGAPGADGGDSSFHTLVVAEGGASGGNGAATTAITTAVPGAPGDGGSATAGDIQSNGGDASPAIAQATSRLYPGLSGASALGGGGNRGVVNGTYPGEVGNSYGGGAGGPVNSPNQALQAGVAGGPGVVIVEIFG